MSYFRGNNDLNQIAENRLMGGNSMKIRKKTLGIFSILIFLTILFSYSTPEKENNATALLLIDIQNFYFPGGKLPLENPEKASLNSRKILESFRERGVLCESHDYRRIFGFFDEVKSKKAEQLSTKFLLFKDEIKSSLPDQSVNR